MRGKRLGKFMCPEQYTIDDVDLVTNVHLGSSDFVFVYAPRWNQNIVPHNANSPTPS